METTDRNETSQPTDAQIESVADDLFDDDGSSAERNPRALAAAADRRLSRSQRKY